MIAANPSGNASIRVTVRAVAGTGLVLALATISANPWVRASGPEPTTLPPGRPVHSNAETASAGRSPLAVRIAMADKVKATEEKLTAEAIAEEAVTEEAITEEAITEKVLVAPEPTPHEVTRAEASPSTASQPKQAGQAKPASQAKPTSERRRLLGIVREKLAELGEPSKAVVKTERPVPLPMKVATVPLDLPKDRPQDSAKDHGEPGETDGPARTEITAPEETVEAVSRPGIPRLVVECEESRAEVRGGEAVTWRITIRNTGAAAHGVATNVFFAEGIEPVHASGLSAVLSPGEVRFDPIETLPTDATVELLVTGEAKQPGAVAYRVEAGCREVPGHAARESVVLVRAR